MNKYFINALDGFIKEYEKFAPVVWLNCEQLSQVTHQIIDQKALINFLTKYGILDKFGNVNPAYNSDFKYGIYNFEIPFKLPEDHELLINLHGLFTIIILKKAHEE